MAQLTLDQLEPGMRLSADVCDKKGRLLLARGCELEPRHLMIFRTWGIGSVEVSGGEPRIDLPEAGDVSVAQIVKARQMLLPLYQYNKLEDPLIATLFKQAVTRKAKHVR